MARTYRLTPATRLINRLSTAMIKAGVAASNAHILTVRGRATGRLRSTPVDVITVGQDRWLVGAYGPSNWTRNARAAGEVTLRRGRRSQRYAVSEPDPADAVPVLREYITRIRVARPYFDATPGSPDNAVLAELAAHPVFRLTPQPAGLPWPRRRSPGGGAASGGAATAGDPAAAGPVPLGHRREGELLPAAVGGAAVCQTNRICHAPLQPEPRKECCR